MQMVLIPWGLWGSLGYMNHTLKIANIEDNYKDIMSLEPKELIWEEPTNFKVKLLFLLKIFSYVKSTQARLVELIFTSFVLPCRFVQMSTVAFIILKFKHSYLYF